MAAPKQTRLTLYALGPSPSWKDACGKPAFAQAVTRFFGADASGPLMPDIRDRAGRPHLRKSGILSGFACQPGCLSKWVPSALFFGRGRPHCSSLPGSWSVNARLRFKLRVRLFDLFNAGEQG